MKQQLEKAAPRRVLIPDLGWELLGVHVVVVLGCALLWFFDLGSIDLRLVLGLLAYLAGICLVLGSTLGRPCQYLINILTAGQLR